MKAIKTIGVILGLLVSTHSFSIDKSTVQAELETMYATDQKHRAEIVAAIKEHGPKDPAVKALWDKQIPIDRNNSKRLAEIVAEYGWPGKSEFGEKAAKAAFLIVQHAKPEVQKKYLPEIRKAAEKGEVELKNLAMLEDRVLVMDGQAQLYGTQLAQNEPGKLEFLPIQDIEKVDERRKTMNLGPIADYAARFGIPSPAKSE